MALLLIGITFAFPTSLSAVLLLVPLLLGVVAVLHLAATRPPRPITARQFLRVSFLGVGILAVAAVLFLLVDTRYGVEAGLLLVVLPGYFVYKALVARDVLFVATSVLFVGAAVVSFLPPINLGPRNIVAYVAFFEIARHLMRHADEAAGPAAAAEESWTVKGLRTEKVMLYDCNPDRDKRKPLMDVARKDFKGPWVATRDPASPLYLQGADGSRRAGCSRARPSRSAARARASRRSGARSPRPSRCRTCTRI